MEISCFRRHSRENMTDESATSTQTTCGDTLRCLPHCTCRCHRSMTNIISPSLRSYLGDLLVPQRVLLAPWSSWTCCDVQTCRGDIQRPVTIEWVLPSGPFPIHLQLSLSTLLTIDVQREASEDGLFRTLWSTFGSRTVMDAMDEETDPCSTIPGGFPQM